MSCERGKISPKFAAADENMHFKICAKKIKIRIWAKTYISGVRACMHLARMHAVREPGAPTTPERACTGSLRTDLT